MTFCRLLLAALLFALLSACASTFGRPVAEMRPPSNGESDAYRPRDAVVPVSVEHTTGAAAKGLTITPAKGGPGVSSIKELALKPAQLIISGSADPEFLFLLLFGHRFSPYSHVALLVQEPEGAIIYEAGSELVKQIVVANLEGTVSRLRFQDWIASKSYAAIYDLPPGVDANKVLAFAKQHARARTPYDSKFDASDGASFYCSEFVARALMAGGGERPPMGPLTQHRSLWVMLETLGVETDKAYFPGDLVSSNNLVAVLSINRSDKLAAIERAALESLFGRFSKANRVGELFTYSSGDSELRYTPAVAGFLRAARGLADKVPELPAEATSYIPPAYSAAVRALEHRYFADPHSPAASPGSTRL